MACITYVKKTFTSASRSTIRSAREIIAEYVRNGFDLTLRQLYYQFVGRSMKAIDEGRATPIQEVIDGLGGE